MTKTTYEIPMIYMIEAASYEEAYKKVHDWNDCRTSEDTPSGFQASCIPSHETDNLGQRVIYLHPVGEDWNWAPPEDEEANVEGM